MADGAPNRILSVAVDEAMAARFEQLASEAGLDSQAFLFDVIADTIVQHDIVDQRTDAARTWQREQAELALAEYDRTGEAIPLEEALQRFRTRVENGLTAKGLL